MIVVGIRLHPPDPESRLPGSQRLAALIQRQQQQNDQQKTQVAALKAQIDHTRTAVQDAQAGVATQNARIDAINATAGLTAVAGQGFSVSLDDSSLSSSPTGNVNDLVIHSQDVQAVVNGMWSSGAEAVEVNNQRLVGTSAVLCVGNTLLINGTVKSPPYEISAVGADRNAFAEDPLVRALRSDAQRYSLKFSVSGLRTITVPAYNGPVAPKYAQPAT